MPSKSVLKQPDHSMKVLVCGGLSLDDVIFLNKTLDELHINTPVTTVISGFNYGADTLAVMWAEARNIPIERFFAYWNLYGKSAGHRRNEQMLVTGNPDLIIAFPGSRGTTHIVGLARNIGITIYIP